MKTPKKLTPDPLVDSIVEVRVRSSQSFISFVSTLSSLLVGKFELFEHSSTEPSITVTPQENGFLINNDSRLPFLVNNDAKVQIAENKLTFNCNGRYIGWQKLSSLIYEVLEIAFSNGMISEVNRVGIRFINQFEDINIFSFLDKKVFYRGSNTHPLDFSYQYIDENGQRVIIKLNGNIIDVKNGINISVVDIGAVREDVSAVNLESTKDIVEALHRTEKETFFGLIKEDFIKEHFNPTY